MQNKTTMLCILASLFISQSVNATTNDMFNLSLEQLLNTQVESATRLSQKLKNAPATMVVVSQRDIKRNGYTNLQEILADVGGYDTAILNAAYFSTSYQRGIRTLGPNRTLFMIDGVVSTMLWDAGTSLSRQYPLNHIERIEFLYGPASAVYGPNAIAGIINVITKKSARNYSSQGNVDWQSGSFNTHATSISIQGQQSDLSYSLGIKLFHSDEPNHSDRLGYLSNDWYSNKDVWGPILDFELNGNQLGKYYDPSKNEGIFASITHHGLTLDYQAWKTQEGYGPFYAADRAQNNVPWEKSSQLYRVDYKKRLFNDFESHTQFIARSNFFGGDWIEAEPDWNSGQEMHSFISFTSWKTVSSSKMIKQDFSYISDGNYDLQFGLNYEQITLTKSYDIPGYWLGAFSSVSDSSNGGPYGYGSGIFHSTDDFYIRPPQPASTMPSNNLINTQDYGIYALTNVYYDKWRYHVGIRFDNNSVYGSSVNPRLSIMHDMSPNLTLKAVYGEAFQEPPAIDLYGGWNGRFANPNLQPEELKSLELVSLYQKNNFNFQASLYKQRMINVIEFNGNQTSSLNVFGIEFRSKYLISDFLSSGRGMKIKFNYTYTDSKRDFVEQYNSVSGSESGAIAPHKLNIGFDFNLTNSITTIVSANYIGERMYSQGNALRDTAKVDDFWTINWVSRWSSNDFSVTFKVNNLLDAEYSVPDSGCGCAGIYENNGERSSGYTNPLIPQPMRAVSLIFSYQI